MVSHVLRYDGATIVSRSVDLGKPVVYVSMNYRYVIGVNYLMAILLNHL